MPLNKVFWLLVLLALLTGGAHAQTGWTDAKPVDPPAASPGDQAGGSSDQSDAPVVDGDTDSEAGDSGDEPANDEARRSRPQTSAEELSWIDEHIADDPFLQPFAAIGPAPEVGEFYDPFLRLAPGAGAIKPQACRYMLQNSRGEVAGQLTLKIVREQSPTYGAVIHISQTTSNGEQVDLWQSAVNGKPLRVLRTRDLGGSRPDEHGVVLKNLERLDVRYLFDRVTVTKTRGGATLAVPTRLRYACFDAAQLPLIMLQLDCAQADWPFEALLFDSTSLETLPLQANRPQRKDVLSAEPRSIPCWEVPLRWGNQQFTWYISRQAPRCLVKFEFGGYTFTLQDYTELK
jgi:hypothetical protein